MKTLITYFLSFSCHSIFGPNTRILVSNTIYVPWKERGRPGKIKLAQMETMSLDNSADTGKTIE
jgi:hypothetical protein